MTEKFRANKDFGQHFLVDKNIISKICESFSQESTETIEVGPGPGAITYPLAELINNFKVVEIDSRFIPHLQELLGAENVINENALNINFNDYFNNQQTGWLVSNLPYNISAPLIVKFTQSSNIHYMTLMMQKEVADKINPLPNTKNSMSSIFALTQTYFEISKLCHVPPGAFSPPPKVNSTVLCFKRREAAGVPIEDFLAFESFLRKLFSERRKQMGGLLKKYYSHLDIPSIFDQLSIESTRRAETLNLQDVHRMFYSFSSKN